ncbi:hypothetical protein ASG36_04615 [Geodermatophilus sp. Leaf369]|uniref:DUF6542 domain-containing protein n=1 Tax=Geodermatophilus sp. Leaf369 TaxID=1736354 RepID=UPI0006F87687|nr:DUF6542 domain-containing protein [Geodermatophilus sp. Leaf369]KQS60255.1 hypothetical protein ASG36_04615 [Geodermatophilus sp. Leaf369]
MRAERHPGDLGGPDPRPRAGAPRGRAAERAERERQERRLARESLQTGRPSGERGSAPRTRRPPADALDRDRRERRAPARAAQTTGPQVRGWLAVLGVFLVTVLGAGADSFVGVGLGTLTLIALVASTVVAAAVVRRRDLVTVLVAPPLVFVAVAGVNIALAPSATFSLPTIATLLIRGFPAMAIAVVAALVVCVVRLVARR